MHAWVSASLGLRPAAADRSLWILVYFDRAAFYVDGWWIFGTFPADMLPEGRIGLVVEGDSASFGTLRVADIEPLPQGVPGVVFVARSPHAGWSGGKLNGAAYFFCFPPVPVATKKVQP